MSVPGHQLRRIYARRRVVAINFLSNISLDGAPTKKDLVRQRITRYSGRAKTQSNEEAEKETCKANEDENACEATEDELEKGDAVVSERSGIAKRDADRHNNSAPVLQPVPFTYGGTHRHTASRIQYKKSVSSNDSEALSLMQSSVQTAPESQSVLSFVAPNPSAKQQSTSTDRRVETASNGDSMSILKVACSVGPRLKAQLSKLDINVTCSFDALRAFGLVRTTDKKTVVSFGALLHSDAARRVAVSGRSVSTVTRVDTSVLQNIAQSSASRASVGTQSQVSLPSNLSKSKSRASSTVVSVTFGGECNSGLQNNSNSYSPNLFDELASQAMRRASRLSASQNELKRLMNEQFRQRFPNCQLTLSKLQSLKRELAQIGRKCALDIAVVACALVLFERLVLAFLICKENRKPCCGACLLLSAKLTDLRDEPLSSLVKELEQSFRIARRELLAYEVAVLVALEFNINVPPALARPHYQRLVESASGATAL